MKSIKTRLSPIVVAIFSVGVVPLSLQADSIVVEGDLDVQAAGSANGDVTVDNELIVNEDTSVSPGVKASLKVEENGVIWAGEGDSYNAADMVPSGSGPRLIWIPQFATFRAKYDGFDDEFSWGVGTVAFGQGEVYGNYAMAWAYGDAYGDLSTAWGDYTTASAYNSTAWGWVTYAYGDHSTAWGYNNFASGYNSTSWGEYTLAEARLSTALGRYNIGGYTYLDDGIYSNDGDTKWFDLDPLFEVGNGTDTNDRSNAVTVLKNGEMTVTNKAWKSELEGSNPLGDPADTVNSSNGNALVAEGHVVVKGKLTLAEAQGDIDMGIYGN